MRDVKNKFGAAGFPLIGFILALVLFAPATPLAFEMVMDDDYLSFEPGAGSLSRGKCASTSPPG